MIEPMEDYPDFHLDVSKLPIAKDWKVGEKYTIQLEVEQMSVNKHTVGFKIIKAKEVDEPSFTDQPKNKFMKESLPKGLAGGEYHR